MALDDPGWNTIYESLHAVLAPDELARARQFKFALDACRFVLSRSILRHLVGEYAGLRPQVVALSYSRYGKPYLNLDGCVLHFSLSHSLGVAVFAFARRQIGVDIESASLCRDLRAVAPLYVSETELRLIEELPGDQHQNAYRQIWTRKEAFLKGVGTGLVDDLKNISVGWPNSPALINSAHVFEYDQEWRMQAIGPFHDASGSLAIAATDPYIDTIRDYKVIPEDIQTYDKCCPKL